MQSNIPLKRSTSSELATFSQDHDTHFERAQFFLFGIINTTPSSTINTLTSAEKLLLTDRYRPIRKDCAKELAHAPIHAEARCVESTTLSISPTEFVLRVSSATEDATCVPQGLYHCEVEEVHVAGAFFDQCKIGIAMHAIDSSTPVLIIELATIVAMCREGQAFVPAILLAGRITHAHDCLDIAEVGAIRFGDADSSRTTEFSDIQSIDDIESRLRKSMGTPTLWDLTFISGIYHPQAGLCPDKERHERLRNAVAAAMA